MTNDTCCTSNPRAHMSVVISTLDVVFLKSRMIESLSFCGISPCILETVKFASLIFSVSQSTFFLVFTNITACVIVKVSYKSQSVSNYHSSFSTAIKNCLIPSNVSSSLLTKTLTGSTINLVLISRTS